VRHDHAAGATVRQRALEVASDVAKPGVDQHAANEIRAHVVSHRRASPRPHAKTRDVVVLSDVNHLARAPQGLDATLHSKYNPVARPRWRPADRPGAALFLCLAVPR